MAVLATCLAQFGWMVGLEANIAKSSAYMAGVTDDIKQQLFHIIGYHEGALSFRYLGVPLALKKLRIADYNTLLDTLLKKIKAWSKGTLSNARKSQLVTSVLQGVKCYWMSILPLPNDLIERIYSMCCGFMLTTKHPPIAWADMCKPKEEGGVGFRDF